jgi:hypothetical protein
MRDDAPLEQIDQIAGQTELDRMAADHRNHRPAIATGLNHRADQLGEFRMHVGLAGRDQRQAVARPQVVTALVEVC